METIPEYDTGGLFRIANQFLAKKITLCQLPFFSSVLESLTSLFPLPAPLPADTPVNLYNPLLLVIVVITACSAGLKLSVLWEYIWASELPYTQQANVAPCIEVICAYILVTDVIEGVSVGSEG